MAAPTTIDDLPDDMLHEIFGHVFAAEPKMPFESIVYTLLPPHGAHPALRCVCRRWRDIADWVRLSTSSICVDTSWLADTGAIRARHPAAFKRLLLTRSMGGHSTSVPQAAISLINGSADLRRALSGLKLETCCLPSVLPAVTPIASCTALTKLALHWGAHKSERVVPSNVLAPLSALRTLESLAYGHLDRGDLPASALRAPLPALPDAPRLTCLNLEMMGNFVPVGSDAALGRLRLIDFWHPAPVRELLDTEDPFLLREAFDAGTWQPSRLTGLQVLVVTFNPVRDSRALVRPSPTGSRPGSEWAPLASQVQELDLRIESGGFKRPSTGIVAGLGALTALRDLRIDANFSDPSALPGAGLLEPVFFDRVRAPQLTHLACYCTTAPVNVARFPDLVNLWLGSMTPQPPLILRSLVARSSLKTLTVFNRILSLASLSLINLAEMFVGGAGWPVLKELMLRNMVLEWDATGLAGAPTAEEFAGRARQLLPGLVKVDIDEPSGGELPDPSRAGFVVACRRHVVPALKELRAGGG